MAPILSHFQSERETMVETDASDYTIGAVLSQQAEDGKIHPCAVKQVPVFVGYVIDLVCAKYVVLSRYF